MHPTSYVQSLNANLRAVSLRCVQQNGPHANGPSYPSELRQRGSADKAEVRTRRDARESSARETSARVPRGRHAWVRHGHDSMPMARVGSSWRSPAQGERRSDAVPRGGCRTALKSFDS